MKHYHVPATNRPTHLDARTTLIPIEQHQRDTGTHRSNGADGYESPIQILAWRCIPRGPRSSPVYRKTAQRQLDQMIVYHSCLPIVHYLPQASSYSLAPSTLLHHQVVMTSSLFPIWRQFIDQILQKYVMVAVSGLMAYRVHSMNITDP